MATRNFYPEQLLSTPYTLSFPPPTLLLPLYILGRDNYSYYPTQVYLDFDFATFDSSYSYSLSFGFELTFVPNPNIPIEFYEIALNIPTIPPTSPHTPPLLPAPSSPYHPLIDSELIDFWLPSPEIEYYDSSNSD